MTRLASLLSASLLAVTVAATGCTVSATTNTSSDLTVTNSSSFDIQELYLTFSTSSGWGANHLGSNPLLPGESITLAGISCDTYDVLLVDQTGAKCEHDNLNLCAQSADFVITNNTCSVFTRLDPGQKAGDLPHPARPASQE